LKEAQPKAKMKADVLMFFKNIPLNDLDLIKDKVYNFVPKALQPYIFSDEEK
jgi:hypothetical protein